MKVRICSQCPMLYDGYDCNVFRAGTDSLRSRPARFDILSRQDGKYCHPAYCVVLMDLCPIRQITWSNGEVFRPPEMEVMEEDYE